MAPAVVVENLSKRYSRNANAHRSYGISDLFREVLGRRTTPRLREDEFFAVKNVSFELSPGDSFALIGRNGSGKTTTLKLLNGLTKPDSGTVTMNGSVQALINLGAGFNPELSGLDNVRTSAALMGLDARATAAIIDEVIEFAELEEFIDSPVITYSSGMTARLGFSVAVHLNPDILLIDEILSVGDYAFQNKCFHKLQELKKGGATLILVSHNNTSVIQLCERALWLHEGAPRMLGPAKETVQAYVDFLEEHALVGVRRGNAKRSAEVQRRATESRAARSPVRRDAAEEAAGAAAGDTASPPPGSESSPKSGREGLYHAIYDEFDHIDDLHFSMRVGNQETDVVRAHDEVSLDYSFRLLRPIADLNVSLVFYRKDGLQLSCISTLNGDLLKRARDGVVRCSVRIPDFNLSPGEYVLVMPIHEGKSYLYRNVVKEFIVKSSNRLAWAILDFPYEIRVQFDGAEEIEGV